MEPLTPEQWEELFTACKQSASHLEMRDWYAAEDERAGSSGSSPPASATMLPKPPNAANGWT